MKDLGSVETFLNPQDASRSLSCPGWYSSLFLKKQRVRVQLRLLVCGGWCLGGGLNPPGGDRQKGKAGTPRKGRDGMGLWSKQLDLAWDFTDQTTARMDGNMELSSLMSRVRDTQRSLCVYTYVLKFGLTRCIPECNSWAGQSKCFLSLISLVE